jgi:hypothetical protein
MAKKKPGNTFPVCNLCGEELECYGAAGKSKHWKEAHPKEWEEYKEKVILPNLKKAVRTHIDEAKKRKRKSRKPVPETSIPQGEGQYDGQDQPDVPETYPPEPEPEPLSKPAVGAMPQQIFTMSGVIPPDGAGFDVEVEDLDAPTSDVRTGTTTIKPVRTNDFSEANVFAYVPKVFQFSSVLLHAAWQVTVQEWGWDPNVPMGKWLDMYLFMTMQRLGVKLMAYQIESPQGGNGDDHKQERVPVYAPDGAPTAADFWTGGQVPH